MDRTNSPVQGSPKSIEEPDRTEPYHPYHIHSKHISDEQTKLSNDGEKIIGSYRAALGKVFEDLDEVELKECEDLAVEWNTKPLLDEIQQKYGNFLLSSEM